MMKIYVVECIADELVQCGFSLNRATAEKQAKIMSAQYTKNTGRHRDYTVEEYKVENEFDFCDFD